jgi:hypothetical protein
VSSARERHVGDGARNTAIAVIEWVNRDEPQMGEPSDEQRVHVARLREPRQNFFISFGTRAGGGAS